MWILVLEAPTVMSQDRFQISSDLYYTEILDSVYLITHHFPQFGSNSLFIVLPGEQGVLIDTPHETTGTRALLAWIRSAFGDLQLTAINTGWHQDNLGGNEYLLSRKIPVYGSGLTATLITDRRDELKEMLLEQTVILDEQRYFESYKEVNFLPPDHTFPIEEGLLGCMILSMHHRRPGFIDHANMLEWPESVERVRERFPTCRWVIPGHGPYGDVELLQALVNPYDKAIKKRKH